MEKLDKKVKIALIIVALIVIGVIVGVVLHNINKPKDNLDNNSKIDGYNESESNVNSEDKVDIINLKSKSRPYAIVVNNTPVAVKVQEGLNKAYMVYEVPTEGNTSRLLAFYKDIKDNLDIGTVRSCRHNFIDFALESDAILCCYGWSIYAENDLKSGIIDYFQGLYGGPFYRKNPEGLASEHTAYTSMQKIIDETKSKGMRTTSDDSVLLNYDNGDVDLSSSGNKKSANTVTIPYGSQTASFKYDESKKMYIRYENNVKCTDYKTKEEVSTKNIIAISLNYEMCENNYYWNLKTTGTGEGYYITNGYAVPITWSKSSRSAKTIYKYKAGTVLDGKDVGGKEITVSDGRTWIEVHTTKQNLVIN